MRPFCIEFMLTDHTKKALYKTILLLSLLVVLSFSCSPAEKISEPAESPLAFALPAGQGELDQTFTYAGKPEITSYPNPVTILYNKGYVSGYDETRGAPAWVAYRVFHIDEYMTNPRPDRFLIDKRSKNRVSHDDYTNSGYDRGHMAPNFTIVSRFGADAQRETFYMSNIIPQRKSLNRHWWQRLEQLIARDYPEAYDEVWVITGPVYKQPGKWLHDKVKVPTHNYKIIQTEIDGQVRMKAFLVHQAVEGNEPHERYLTTVRHLEELTGLNFNPLFEVSFADSAENVMPDSLW
jgi:endonuclease G, mitochondrial